MRAAYTVLPTQAAEPPQSSDYSSGSGRRSRAGSMSADDYEREYLEVSRRMSRLINEVGRDNIGIDRILALAVEADTDAGEANALLTALEVEIAKGSPYERRNNEAKASRYRNDLRALVRDFNNAKHRAEAKELKGSTGNDARTKDNLQTAMEIGKRTVQVGEQTRQVMHETEDIGGQTLTTLAGQNEQLDNAQTTVQQTYEHTSMAHKILRMMSTRALRHKIFLYFFIIFLLAMICVVIYFLYVKKK